MLEAILYGLLRLLRVEKVQALFIYLAEEMAKQTDNTIDDQLVVILKNALKNTNVSQADVRSQTSHDDESAPKLQEANQKTPS